MATTAQIGGTTTERVFIGTDWTKRWKVQDLDADAAGLTAKDIAGWAITFDIRHRKNSNAPALFSKTLTITGVFNSVLATSTQYMVLTILDTELTTAIFSAKGGTYAYSIKRTDDGFEAILAEGEIVIERVTQV